jgi:hypothetical protein
LDSIEEFRVTTTNSGSVCDLSTEHAPRGLAVQ